MNTIVISTTNHSHWSDVHQLSYRRGAHCLAYSSPFPQPSLCGKQSSPMMPWSISSISSIVKTGAEPHKKEGALRLIVMTEGNGHHFENKSAEWIDLKKPGQYVYWLVVWNMDFMTFHILGIIIPTDYMIFFRGVGQPPTR